MARIEKVNNARWRPKDYLKAGAIGAGLGAGAYLGYKGYQAGRLAYDTYKGAKDVYDKAKLAMVLKRDLETAKMLAQGTSYIPSIPGGFPSI